MPTASISLYRKEKKRAKIKNDLIEVANFCNLLGTELQENGQYDCALGEHKEALEIYEKCNDLEGIAIAHRRMGEVYSEIKHFKEALEHQEKFLNIAIETADAVQQQRAYATLGRTYYQYAESLNLEDDNADVNTAIKESEKAYQRALRICDKLSGKVDSKELSQMRCRVYHNLGLVVDMKNESSSAIKFITQALELCLDHNLYEDAYRAFSELSRIHLRIGLKDKALEEAKKSLNMALKIQKRIYMVDSYVLVAYMNLVLDDFIAAKKNYYKGYKLKYSLANEQAVLEENLKIVVNICRYRDLLSKSDGNLSDETIIETYEKLGDCYAGLKVNPGQTEHYDHAIKFYKKTLNKSLESNKDNEYLAIIYSSLAKTYSDKKQFVEALEYYKKEFDIQIDTKEQIITLIEMARILLRSSDHNTAENYFQQAFNLAEKTMQPKLQMHIIQSHMESPGVSKNRKDLLKKQLIDLSESFGIDPDFELTDDENSVEEDMDLNLIDFSDSDEEFIATKSGRRQCQGLKINRTATGDTPLHLAAIKNNINQVKRLLQQKHSVNLRDNSGWLPIHEACNYGHVEIVELLIEAGAFINDRGGKECSGITPLHDAASNGHLDVIRVLLKNGASVLVRDDQGLTPLDHLIKCSSTAELSPEELQEFRDVQNQLLECMEKAGYVVPYRVRQNMEAIPLEHRLEGNSYSKAKKRSNTYNYLPDLSNILSDESNSPEHQSLVTDEETTIDNGDLIHNIGRTISFVESPKKSGADVYKNAMKTVGSHSKQIENGNLNYSTLGKATTHRPLIPEDSYFEGHLDWMVDDCGMSKKRKRREQFEFAYKEHSHKSSDNKNPVKKKKHMQPKISNMIRKQSTIAEESKELSELNSDLDECLEGRISDDEPIIIKRKNNENNSLNKISPRSNNYDLSMGNIMQPVLRLSVKINDKKFLIPIAASSFHYNICWLEEEVSKKYMEYAKHRVKLNLITSKEEILNPNDLISMTLSSDNCELVATNIEVLDLPPMPDIYVSACKDLQLTEYVDICKSLGEAESSCIFELNNRFFRSEKDLKPIMLAIQHQNLQVIKLSFCRIEDTGFALLLESITSLKVLQKLEASTCSLTVESLEKLCELATKEPNAVKKLTYLDLSYNYFSDTKLSVFKSLFSFPSLNYLNLQSCDMNISYSRPFEFTCSLHTLNLNYNEISLGCFSTILNCCSTLTHLSMKESLPSVKTSRIGLSSSPVLGMSLKEPCIGDSLSKLIGVGSVCFLKHLNIAKCGVMNEDVRLISSHLHQCFSLTYLNLSDNDSITACSITVLLQEIQANPELPLQTLFLHGINSLGESDSFTNLLKIVLDRKGFTSYPFTAVSVPESARTIELSEEWKQHNLEKAVVLKLVNQLFFNVKL